MSVRQDSGSRAAFERRLEALREAPAYRNYLVVREHVLAMLDRTGETPSRYWQEELEALDYLLDASPLVIERLRRHCHLVTGIRPYEYRTGTERQAAAFEAKIDALADLAGGTDLLVPEHPALGGFGWNIKGGLFNVDTIKFFEVLVGMQLAGVLERFGGDERRVVCEIGAGWGGFAAQFKTLFPDVTYVIVDLPELFLFGATYLTTLFPGARVAYWDEPGAADELGGPEPPDFVFVPNGALDELTPPRLDLVVNMVSFQEMTTEQVDRYAAWAERHRSPYLYSLNRNRSGYNTELTGVREILARHFAVHEVKVLPVPYTRPQESEPRGWLRRSHRPKKPGKREYRHLLATPKSD